MPSRIRHAKWLYETETHPAVSGHTFLWMSTDWASTAAGLKGHRVWSHHLKEKLHRCQSLCHTPVPLAPVHYTVTKRPAESWHVLDKTHP
jgi:hypothetical protein